MGIRELQESQEGLQTIELTGDEARIADNRIARIIKYTDLPEVIYVGSKEADFRKSVTYHIKNSTVYFDINMDTSRIAKDLTISIASPVPEYRQESLSRLEQMMEMRLRKGERPAVITAQH